MHPVEDADPQGHEGLREVDDLLPLSGDGEGCHSQVCLLLEGKQVGRREGARDRDGQLETLLCSYSSRLRAPNCTMVKSITATPFLF